MVFSIVLGEYDMGGGIKFEFPGEVWGGPYFDIKIASDIIKYNRNNNRNKLKLTKLSLIAKRLLIAMISTLNLLKKVLWGNLLILLPKLLAVYLSSLG